MVPIKEKSEYKHLLIVDKYERIINYLYPIMQSVPRKHGIIKEMMIKCLFEFPSNIIQAGKSEQVSKIYIADANLANLRFWLRFLFSIKCLTNNQLQYSQLLISEIGELINEWVKEKKQNGRNG